MYMTSKTTVVVGVRRIRRGIHGEDVPAEKVLRALVRDARLVLFVGLLYVAPTKSEYMFFFDFIDAVACFCYCLYIAARCY